MTIHGTRRGSPAALAIIAVVVMGIGAWVLLNSAFFSIREVRVEGAESVSDQDIRALAEVKVGENLITLPTGDVSERVESDPWILDAVVERDLPTTLVITVIERSPGGWLEDPDGFAVVAGDRTVVSRSDTAPEDLPELGSWPDPLGAGDRIEALGTPLRVTSSMTPTLLREIASAGMVGETVELELRSGATVLYGEATSIAAKNAALSGMIRWAAGRGIEIRSVDVRVPSAPSLTPQRGAKVSPPIV